MNQRPYTFGRTAGFSLIELLVAMVIGLVVTLAITSVLIRSESSRRTNTSVNDVDQTGTYSAFILDRAVRSAGSGFSQSWSSVFGCRLDVAQGSTKVLPIPASTLSTSSAFAGVTSTTLPIRMAPVVIASGLAGAGGDVLMVMGGTGGAGESQQEVKPGSTATVFLIQNALGYATNDLVLLADPSVTALKDGCMVQQVNTRAASAPGPDLPMGVASGVGYYATTGTNVNLADFIGKSNTIALKLGNTENMPQIQLYGVGANNTLFSLDLLRPMVSSVVPDIPIADGVVEMRAVYGLDTVNAALAATPDGIVDSWVDPSATNYTATALMDGSAGAQTRLRQISAIRIGLILRTSIQEKAPVIGPADSTGLGTVPLTLTLFGDLPTAVQHTRTFAAGTLDLNYRYRTIELTIPLRNVLLAPST